MAKSSTYRSRLDPADANFEYRDTPFYNIARLINLYHQKLDAALKPIGIDAPRWRILNTLRTLGTATVTQVSTEVVIKMSTTAKIIQRMTSDGLVTTRPYADDARSTEVFLTDEGRQLLDIASQKVGAISRNAFYNLSDSDIEIINALTRKMYGNLFP